MRSHIKVFVLFSSVAYTAGCVQEPERKIETIPFNAVSGTQSDINYQRLDVFNDYDSYSAFLASLPSYKGALPDFDEVSDTLVSIVLYSDPCSFTPSVSKAWKEEFYDGSTQVSISIDNKSLAETPCESGTSQYNIYFVVFGKTDDHISLFVDNKNYGI